MDDHVVLTRNTLSKIPVTFMAWVKTTNATTSSTYAGNTPNTIIGDQSGGVGHGFGIYGGGPQVRHHNGSGWVSARSAVTISDGKWHHVAYTWLPNTTEVIKIYIDGVEATSLLNESNSSTTTLDAGSNVAVAWDRIAGSYASGSVTQDTFDGEIKDVRIHNRALESDEVAAAYNGQSTPWKYAYASRTERLTDGVFETWASSSNITNWTEYTEGSSTVAQSTDEYAGTYAASLVIDSSDNSVGIFQSGTVVAGRNYRVTFWAKANSGTPTLGVRTAPNSGNGVASNTGHETHTLTTSYAHYTTEFTAPAGHGNLILFRGTGASKTIFIDSVSLVECGEVAAYTPKSLGRRYEETGNAIKDKWFDETSNANHGTITGATSVGNTRVTHYGDLDMVDGGKLRINKQDNLTPITSRYTQYNYGHVDTTPNNDGWSIKLATVKSLDCLSTGEVQVTSGTSTNLRPVARVSTSEITGDGTAVAFDINHNLGSNYVQVSVREKDNGSGQLLSYVETEIRGGAWADANGALETVQNNSGTSHSTVIFATAPANGVAYYVTCVGS